MADDFVTLEEAMTYVRFCHPRGEALSHVRAILIVYLADWKSAVERGRQITDVHWKLDDSGPRPEDYLTIEIRTRSWPDWTQIRALKHQPEYQISSDSRAVLDAMVARTQPMDFAALFRLVSSTFPVITQERYSLLNLVALAAQYRALGLAPA